MGKVISDQEFLRHYPMFCSLTHVIFGKGVLKNIENGIITVQFESVGIKKLDANTCVNNHYITISKKIIDVIRDRKIKYLFHFTRRDNVFSIASNGLLTVNEMEKRDIKYYLNNPMNNSYRTNSICVTIEYPNSYVLKTIRKDFGEKLAIIVIDAKILCDRECVFAEHNSRVRAIAQNFNKRNDVAAFENMFSDVIEGVKSNGKPYKYNRADLHNKHSYLPTSRQAEIIIKGNIDQSYIRKIMFESSDDMSPFLSELYNRDIEAVADFRYFAQDRNEFEGFEDR